MRPKAAKYLEEKVLNVDSSQIKGAYLQHDGSTSATECLFRIGTNDARMAQARYARRIIYPKRKHGLIPRQESTQFTEELYLIEERVGPSYVKQKVVDVDPDNITSLPSGQDTLIKIYYTPINNHLHPPNHLATHQTITSEGEPFTSVIPPQNTALGVVLVIALLFFFLFVVAVIVGGWTIKNLDPNKIKQAAAQNGISEVSVSAR